jgi:starvation-inducible DNA-binding protein
MTKTNTAEGLAVVLAGTVVLSLKTRNYHWNVTGPHFKGLHLLFDEQYNALNDAADEVAERLRALRVPAPGSFAAFSKLSPVSEETESPDWKTMLKTLSADHLRMAEAAKSALDAAEAAGDDPTIDLLTQRIAAHQTAGWMLSAHLE